MHHHNNNRRAQKQLQKNFTTTFLEDDTEEIQENDFNLNIPRYVDTFEEEAEVDIAAVQQEIVKLEDELKSVQSEIEVYLKQLTQ
jgi:type I restriction-modification system DNA methylase subunit